MNNMGSSHEKNNSEELSPAKKAELMRKYLEQLGEDDEGDDPEDALHFFDLLRGREN